MNMCQKFAKVCHPAYEVCPFFNITATYKVFQVDNSFMPIVINDNNKTRVQKNIESIVFVYCSWVWDLNYF